MQIQIVTKRATRNYRDGYTLASSTQSNASTLRSARTISRKSGKVLSLSLKSLQLSCDASILPLPKILKKKAKKKSKTKKPKSKPVEFREMQETKFATAMREYISESNDKSIHDQFYPAFQSPKNSPRLKKEAKFQ